MEHHMYHDLPFTYKVKNFFRMRYLAFVKENSNNPVDDKYVLYKPDNWIITNEKEMIDIYKDAPYKFFHNPEFAAACIRTAIN